MNQGAMSSSQNFPLDNLVFDLMMVIIEKSKGLEAMNQYLQDAQSNHRVKDSFEKIRKQDTECIRELTQHLSFLIGQQSTGQAGAAAAQRPPQGSGQSTTGGSSNR
ncbi:MAG: hypothetical protein AB7U82_22105 [Blastocatellales bacterium]